MKNTENESFLLFSKYFNQCNYLRYRGTNKGHTDTIYDYIKIEEFANQ